MSPVALSDTTKRILPWLVAVGFFMEALDTTILNTAVPTIAAALGVGPLSMKSALTSYTLSLAVFIPISGWMADRYGTKRIFFGAIGVFTLGSLLCGISNDIHVLVLCRVLQGLGGAMMVPVGRLTMIRTFAKSELIRAMTFVAIPGLIGPLLGPLIGGVLVSLLHWRAIFFVNVPIGLLGLYLVHRHMPDYRVARSEPLDVVGLVLFGSGVALLSYVLEVFGEHSLSVREISLLFALSIVLLLGYWRHALTTRWPLLRLDLFAVRTFRTAVTGSFLTRLGVGGMPFLLPLLYQVGLGHTPIESGLLIMPQFLAAMSLKPIMPRMLARFGHRRVLMSNTFAIGALIAAFALVGPNTPVAIIVALAFFFGFSSSLQYTSMNTLAYADVNDAQASMASTIASMLQQMSMSFGVATASLVASMFIADRFHTAPDDIVHGLHRAFVILGALTMISTVLFRQLRDDDGNAVSQHKVALPTQ